MKIDTQVINIPIILPPDCKVITEQTAVGVKITFKPKDEQTWLEPAYCFERLVAALEGRDAYQITVEGGIAGDIERVRAALIGKD